VLSILILLDNIEDNVSALSVPLALLNIDLFKQLEVKSIHIIVWISSIIIHHQIDIESYWNLSWPSGVSSIFWFSKSANSIVTKTLSFLWAHFMSGKSLNKSISNKVVKYVVFDAIFKYFWKLLELIFILLINKLTKLINSILELSIETHECMRTELI